MFAVNFVNKLFVQSMEFVQVIIELTLLPCHVYTGISTYSLLSTSSTARGPCYNLLLYCAWMPLLALVFPDLSSARALSSRPLRLCSIGAFYAHHVVLLCTPVALHHLAKAGRFAVPTGRGLGFLQYLSFIYAFVGVLLCGASLALGRNLNYSLWPPPALPAALLTFLGGSRYRLSIGGFLAFVMGPAMRYLVVPAASALVGGLARCLGLEQRKMRAKRE